MKRHPDLYYFDQAVEAAERLQRNIRRVARKKSSKDPHSYLSYFFFTKTLTSLRAVEILWSNGFFPDSLLLMRSIFETFVLDLYIRLDKTNLTARYFAHEATARHGLSVGMLRSLKNQDGGWREACKGHAAQFGRAAKNSPYEFEDTKNWSGKSLRDIVRILDRKGLEGVWMDYEFFYAISSAVSHASSLSIQEYMTRPTESSYRRFGHRRGYLRDLPILSSRWCLCIGTFCAMEHFQGTDDMRLAQANFDARVLIDSFRSDLEGKPVCTLPNLGLSPASNH